MSGGVLSCHPVGSSRYQLIVLYTHLALWQLAFVLLGFLFDAPFTCYFQNCAFTLSIILFSIVHQKRMMISEPMLL